MIAVEHDRRWMYSVESQLLGTRRLHERHCATLGEARRVAHQLRYPKGTVEITEFDATGLTHHKRFVEYV